MGPKLKCELLSKYGTLSFLVTYWNQVLIKGSLKFLLSFIKIGPMDMGIRPYRMGPYDAIFSGGPIVESFTR